MDVQQYRGIESFELNDYFVIVQAPIESVSEAFNQTKHATLWERDVYEREVNIAGPGFIVFRFQGHLWTLIHGVNFPAYSEATADAQTLSRLLSVRALSYAVSDTSDYISYELYDKGLFVERLEYVEGSVQFKSQLRQLEVEDIGAAYKFIDNFMREQDIYIPALFRAELEVSQRVTITLEGLTPDSLETTVFPKSYFERVDYLSVMN